MISKFLSSLLTLCVAYGVNYANAQNEEAVTGPYGFIRLMNAVSVGKGQLDILIDGKPVRPEGYQLGNMTGGISLRPKSYSVEFRREGVKKGVTKVNVALNDTTTLVAFAELVPASDEKPAEWEIRILRLKQFDPTSKRTASFVSVSREPELKIEMQQSNEKWESVMVKRFDVVRADINQAHGYLPIRYKDRQLKAMSIAPSGNFVAILYDDENGLLQSKNFIDYKYLSSN